MKKQITKTILATLALCAATTASAGPCGMGGGSCDGTYGQDKKSEQVAPITQSPVVALLAGQLVK